MSSATLSRAYFQNIGLTRRCGVEATIDYRAGTLSIHAGYALTDTTFLTALTLNSPLNPAANPEETILVERGDRIPGVPRHRATLSLIIKDPAGVWC